MKNSYSNICMACMDNFRGYPAKKLPAVTKKDAVEERKTAVEEKKAKKEEIVEKPTEEVEKEKGDDAVEKDNDEEKGDDEEKTDNKGKKKVKIPAEYMIPIEKLGGKIEMLTEIKTQNDERFSQVSEQMGELRRMYMDREKDFQEMETVFDKLKDMVDEINPQKVSKKFEKLSLDIEKLDAKLEKSEMIAKKTRKEIDLARKTFSRVKSVDNVLRIAETLDVKIKKIEEARQFSEKTAAKAETVFSEMNENIATIKKEMGTLEKIDDVTKDLIKDMEKLKLKMDNEVVKKKDLTNMQVPDAVKPDNEKLDELIKSLQALEKDKLEKDKKIEEIQMQGSALLKIENLEKEKEKIREAMREAENEMKSGELSKKTYYELAKSNNKSLNEIDSMLEGIGKDILYKKMQLLESRVEKLSTSASLYATRPDIEGVEERMKYLESFAEGSENFGSYLRKSKELQQILLNKIEALEASVQSLKERQRGKTDNNTDYFKKHESDIRLLTKKYNSLKNIEHDAEEMKRVLDDVSSLKMSAARKEDVEELKEHMERIMKKNTDVLRAVSGMV